MIGTEKHVGLKQFFKERQIAVASSRTVTSCSAPKAWLNSASLVEVVIFKNPSGSD